MRSGVPTYQRLSTNSVAEGAPESVTHSAEGGPDTRSRLTLDDRVPFDHRHVPRSRMAWALSNGICELPRWGLAASILVLTGNRVLSYSYVMRYSPEHKAQNHENILSAAARSFREHGADISGIGTVMKKVGLTKGGFYRHFERKDDLFVEAVARALEEMGRSTLEVAKSAPEGRALRVINRTLSECTPREFARSGLCGRRPRARAGAKAAVRAETD